MSCWECTGVSVPDHLKVLRSIFQKIRKIQKTLKLRKKPKMPNLPMLREPLGGQQVEEVKEDQQVEEVEEDQQVEEVEEDQQEEEVESEEVVGRSPTGTAVCRRVTFPGMIKSFGCTS